MLLIYFKVWFYKLNSNKFKISYPIKAWHFLKDILYQNLLSWCKLTVNVPVSKIYYKTFEKYRAFKFGIVSF